MPHDAPALQAMSWPAELRLVRTVSIADATAFLAGRTSWPTRLKIQQYASPEAQVGGAWTWQAAEGHACPPLPALPVRGSNEGGMRPCVEACLPACTFG